MPILKINIFMPYICQGQGKKAAKDSSVPRERDIEWGCPHQFSWERLFGEYLRKEPEAHVGKDSLLLCDPGFSPTFHKYYRNTGDSPCSPT